MKIRDWYFQGWERVEDENGRRVFKYTGEVYTFPGNRKRFSLIAALLTAALAVLYGLVAFLPAAGGMWHYAAIPQLTELIPLFYLILGLVQLLRAKEPLTYRDWHASWRRMHRAAFCSMLLTGAMALVEIIFILALAESYFSEALYLLEEIGCAAISAGLWLLLRKNTFDPSPSSSSDKE